MVITMTEEDKAWEQFSKADATNISDSSAQGMLQAIMAELNSVKADTARLAQKVDGEGGPTPPTGPEGLEGMPPMDGGMPPMDGGMPPMGGEGAPQAEGESPMADEEGNPPMGGGLPDIMPPMGGGMPIDPDLNSGMGVGSGPESDDETLLALQDALSQVEDPKAISKLADIIKEYVEENYPDASVKDIAEPAAPIEEDAAVPDEVIEEVIENAIADGAMGDEAPMEGMGDGGESEVSPELLDALFKSAGIDGENTDAVSSEDVEDTMKSEDSEHDKEDNMSTDDENAPAIQINLFLGAKIEDIIKDNEEKGLTDSKDLPTETFKVCDQPSVKKSIDDLINERMRMQSGIDGKRYKITKSASEKKAEAFEAMQKSIDSFDAVRGMRVGDVLTTMYGLKNGGMKSIEKSYTPIIDEMVKYCDNNISPVYTAPIFKSFGVDLDKIYEPVDLESFTRIKAPMDEKKRIDVNRKSNQAFLDRNVSDDALRDQIMGLITYMPHVHNMWNDQDKDMYSFPRYIDEAISANLYPGGRAAPIDDFARALLSRGFDRRTVNTLVKDARGRYPTGSLPTDEEYVQEFAPYLFALRYGYDPKNTSDKYDFETIKNAYHNLSELEPRVGASLGSNAADYLFDQRFNTLLNRDKLSRLVGKVSDLSKMKLPTRAQFSTEVDRFGNEMSYDEHLLADDAVRVRKFLTDLYANGTTKIPISGVDKNGNPITTEYDIAPFLDAMKYEGNADYDLSYGSPGDVFSKTFATWRSPAMRLDDNKLYSMDKDGISGLNKYLQKMGKGTYTKDSTAALAVKKWLDTLGAPGTQWSDIETARDNAIKAIYEKYPDIAGNIFGSKMKGYSNGVISTSPMAPFLVRGKNGIQFHPDLMKQYYDWEDTLNGIPSGEDLQYYLDTLSSDPDVSDTLGTARLVEDPESLSSIRVGNTEGSFNNTLNTQGSYKGGERTRIGSELKDLDDVMYMGSKIDPNDYEGMSNYEMGNDIKKKLGEERANRKAAAKAKP